jgi:uncharacterized protein involved in cysteine biosynthesis
MSTSDASASDFLDEFLSRPCPRTSTQKFVEGFRAPWDGLRLLRQHRSLWPYALPPILLNLFITTVVFGVLLLVAFIFVVHWHPWFTENQEGAQRAIWIGIEVAAILMLAVVCVALAFMTWKLLSGILCGHQYGKLAAQTEMLLGMEPEQLTEISFKYQVVDTFIDLGSMALNAILFMIVGGVPIIGPPLALFGTLYRTWFLLGFDYFDFPLALRGMRRTDKLEHCRQRRPYILGLGSTVFIMEFVPILSAILLTTAVIGAVLLQRRTESGNSDETADCGLSTAGEEGEWQ